MIINIYLLFKVIKNLDIDIIHARSRAPAWVAYITCKLTRKPFITTFHSAYSATYPLKRFYNSVMLRGNRIIAISDFIKKHIETRYQFKSNRLEVIYRGVDLRYFSPNNVTKTGINKIIKELGINNKTNQKVLLLPARFTRLKGHLYLLNALKYLKDRNFICIMVGKRSDKQYEYFLEIEQTITNLKLNKNVILHVTPISDMPSLYSVADLVICSSLEPEGFGRTIIEAQAMEKIVVSTNIGGPAEIIENNINGFLGPLNDASTFADIIEKALNLDVKVTEKITKVALDKVKKFYSIELMCEKTIKIYEQLMLGK